MVTEYRDLFGICILRVRPGQALVIGYYLEVVARKHRIKAAEKGDGGEDSQLKRQVHPVDKIQRGAYRNTAENADGTARQAADDEAQPHQKFHLWFPLPGNLLYLYFRIR